ncbi:NUDIX hydrolase [Anaerosphaera multitolerans]|uniref:NUDIX domain-containing protein n=1 Tax=Anaerosphaera multitolerans TaxID=2487351 RepID=A0A437S805_9FIRM|nr:NUDIX domain-containing protein [Anaerosphaera multitolerans]RVU55061.1 NUDIX domain-containing protein [Anaerosphaera multitolerans]
MAEFWDVYNSKGKKKNKVIKKGQPLLEGEYHLIVECWIRCGKNLYLLQKRSANKKMFPNMWYCSAGGSVHAGEEPRDGLIREVKEELGLDISKDEIKLKRIIFEESSIFYIYLVDSEVDLNSLKLQSEEVAEAKIASLEEIKELIREGKMIYLDYYDKFFKSVEKIPYLI